MPDVSSEVVVALLALLVTLTSALLSGFVAERRRRRAKKYEQEHRRLYSQALALYAKELGEQQRPSPLAAIDLDLQRWVTGLGTPPVTGADKPPTKEEVRHEVEGAVRAVQERIERIELRFPEQSTIDKVASVNDAILATKVEQLQKSIEQLDSRILTKWDVATIVFAVMAAIGVVAGVIFAVANFVLK